MTPKSAWLRAKRARERAARNNRELEQRKVESTAPQTYEVLQGTRLNVDNPDSIQQLREMAQRGEYPEFITSMTREGRERFYEEFDKLYPDPPGILNDYRVEPLGLRGLRVIFNYSLAEAESPGVINLPDKNSGEAVRRGLIKYAIYQTRPRVEYALGCRRGGFSDYQLAHEYGGRVVSTAERDLVNAIMTMQVSAEIGSPLSRQGRAGIEGAWKPKNGGWVRYAT